jgi:hypothetical protein
MLHLDSKRSAVVVAPDEILLLLSQLGHSIQVGESQPFRTALPKMRSQLQMTDLDSVDPREYEVCGHMFRDPDPEEVLRLSEEFKGWFPRNRVVNHISDLAAFEKRTYLPLLERLGIGPTVRNLERESMNWGPDLHGAAVST